MREKHICIYHMIAFEPRPDPLCVEGHTPERGKSFRALEALIRAIGRQEILPFNDNPLVHVLQESFVGYKRMTCFIATIASGIKSFNTPRHAQQLKKPAVIDSSERTGELIE
ncbi:kinesin-like protein Klp10A [Anopheles sinensis]|uniref:Kinesin-like protein Klp10A n=1 Tax=Anopheles sinensis TaxID=74873 RepID=A0A084W417_ANOSI|nr:kinesin-like protein Klp10A [Anopheles sinensis]